MLNYFINSTQHTYVAVRIVTYIFPPESVETAKEQHVTCVSA
jgi:hypothetical protein